jgi:2-polyprenyl-3-methyl-5-hydroxy-6-metoxy-1,4-benzoquinol methylase
MTSAVSEVQYPSDDLFVSRSSCIACGSSALETLAGGRFGDDPLRGFIASDPWGESPLPRIEQETWEFVRCGECQQKFHRRILSPPWQQVLFTRWMSDAAIREFEERHGVNTPSATFEQTRAAVRHVLRLEKMTRALRSAEQPLRILDFGCGWGRFLAVASLFGAETYGVDKDQDRQRGAENLGVRVEQSLDDLDASLRGALDAITLFQVLEHLEHPISVLRELRAWLRPGGIMILETPNAEGVTSIQSPQDYRAINPLSHINGFTPDALRAIAERAGFESVMPAPAHATAEPLSVAKTEMKRAIGLLPNSSVSDWVLPRTTDQYFRLP